MESLSVRRRVFYFRLDKRRASLDPESGQAIFICLVFTFDHAVIWRLEKRATVRFCALKRETRPVRLQLAGPLAKKFSKVVAPRDTKHPDQRELTEGKLSISNPRSRLPGCRSDRRKV